VHPTPKKPIYSKESIINSYEWHFKPFQVNFMCYLSKPSNTSHFVTLFLAHEDIVVGFVICHTKLSTPRLACFIYSSLILQGSWLDHYNFKKKKEKKEALLHGMRMLAGTRRIRLAMVRERKGWEECDDPQV
jgi:hypothetical protein